MNRPQPEDEISAALELRKVLQEKFPDMPLSSFMQRAHRFIVRPEETDETMTTGQDYLSVPRNRVYSLVHKYFNELEVSKTTEFCICAWAVHPDDEHLPAGHPKRRLRKIAEHEYCPMHTHIGRVIGFFDWLFKEDGPTAMNGYPGEEPITGVYKLAVESKEFMGFDYGFGIRKPFTLNDGTEITVEEMPGGEIRCTERIDGVPCRMTLSPAGDMPCANTTRHDHPNPDHVG